MNELEEKIIKRLMNCKVDVIDSIDGEGFFEYNDAVEQCIKQVKNVFKEATNNEKTTKT